jgi:hypothetical protein
VHKGKKKDRGVAASALLSSYPYLLNV